ncbi:hypothetical protein GGS21DRAFT_544195 [Xylaria nigripes]|nr:hypothetical protein GGS21DRAFT_544195 [Xylaria nigripes]
MASWRFRGRRTRSASLSSESSFGVGGGAPLNADLSELNISDNNTVNTHHRSASEMLTSRTAEPARSASSSVAGSSVYTETARDADQDNFQIGKPPHDDEEVFNTSPSTSQHLLAGPVPIIKQDETSRSIVPIHAQPTPSERRHLVQGVDAQTYYPAEACIFVANLPESKSDTVLEVAITKAFSSFGPVFVKIRRDPKNMPFAFCQYTDSTHAQKAQKEGKGLLVEGRPCRTEMVKANRCYVMFHRKGHQLSIAEAQSHLVQFGDIAKLEPLRDDAVEAMKLPGAVFVEYTQFDPGRDIISAYRYNEELGVVAYDLKKVNPNQINHYANYLARYEVDRRSIYVGNLPHNVENIEEVLRHAASAAGNVEAVQVIRKEPRNENGRPTVFAFVEYERPDQALDAVERLRGTILVNSRIRVEKKKCADQGSQFRGSENMLVTRSDTSVSTTADAKEETGTVPATPARPFALSTHVVASGGGIDVSQGGPQGVSPDPNYRPMAYSQRRSHVTPTAYNRGRPYAGPDQVYQPNTYTSPVAYGQAQYASPHQAYQQGQYMSPNYALSPGYQHRQYGQGNYSPATPQVLGGAQTPYHGSGSGYYQNQASPYWRTPYLQDQNDGYQYYAGYGMHHQYTPLGAAARSVNMMNADQTPTRQNEAATEQHDVETPKQVDEGDQEKKGEEK